MKSNLLDVPVYNNVNLKTFPMLGAFPGEVGSGNSPGGIGLTWPMQVPLAYYFNTFGTKKRSFKKRSNKRSNKRSSKKIASKRYKTMCKNYLKKKISKNMKEYKKGRYSSRKQAITVSYSQLRKKYKKCKK